MKTSKILALLLAVLMVVSVFAACSNGDAESTNSAEPTDDGAEVTDNAGEEGDTDSEDEEVESFGLELSEDKTTFTHWTGYNGADREVLTKIFNRFNESDELGQIDVSVMSWDILNQKLVTAYASGSGPDTICGGTALRQNWYQGYGLDMSPAYDDGRLTLDIYPQSVLDDIQFDDGIWATPMCVFGVAMYMNMDKLAEAGYTAGPKSTDELVEMGKKMTKVADSGEVEQYGFAFDYDLFFSYFMWDKGYDVVDL